MFCSSIDSDDDYEKIDEGASAQPLKQTGKNELIKTVVVEPDTCMNTQLLQLLASKV